MNNPPEDYEQHDAWMASLTPDELMLVYTPSGYLWMFIHTALAKRALLAKDITPRQKLALLEAMHSFTDRQFTEAMIATIEPMGDLEYEIFKEARSLDPPDAKLTDASFKVLTSCRVFGHLATLNPSYLAAMRLHENCLAIVTAEMRDRHGTVSHVQSQIGELVQ